MKGIKSKWLIDDKVGSIGAIVYRLVHWAVNPEGRVQLPLVPYSRLPEWLKERIANPSEVTLPEVRILYLLYFSRFD